MTHPNREAGVLLPLFSIPSRRSWGLGEIPDVVTACRWLRGTGHTVLNILPINEPALGQASPYSALTAFALDPVYASVEDLEDFHAVGGHAALTDEQRTTIEWARQQPVVDWGAARWLKRGVLERAFAHFRDTEWRTGSERARALTRYVAEHANWLLDYALFRALKDTQGPIPWWDWDPALRDLEPERIEQAREQYADQILLHEYLQWVTDEQWQRARREVSSLGMRIMGDLPFMVARDSADVWVGQHEFRMDAEVGVPPDAFSEDGQKWGLPPYDWSAMEKTDFEWVKRRGARAKELYDLYRVDHVVGLYRTYFFPDDGSEPRFDPAEPAAQRRHGERIMRALGGAGRVIAEDLGCVPDFVRESLSELGIPGYRVMRWEKDDDTFRDPADWPELSVATTGTHDTESLAVWWEALDDDERAQVGEVPSVAARLETLPETFTDDVRDALLTVIYESPSELALIPFQDLFGHNERVNLPGTSSGENWTYRLPWPVEDLASDPELMARSRDLADLTRRSGRAS